MRAFQRLAAFSMLLTCLSTGRRTSAAQEPGQEASHSAPSAQQPLQLDDVLKEALEKNPEAQSAQHTIKALERRVPQAQALPDPVIGVGWAGNLAPFSTMSGDPSSYRGITVSQQFPTAGKLKLQAGIAKKDV